MTLLYEELNKILVVQPQEVQSEDASCHTITKI